LKNNNQILISSSTKNLHIVRDFIEQKAKEINLESKIVNQIIVSVDEACTNIIKHTYKYDESNTIEVEYKSDNKKFIVIIRYKGKSFDPSKKHNPNMKQYFAKYKVGGLGIPLIKKSMDKIEYSHIKPDLNALTLIKVI
jgi:serine/threonine-protein kinase RsbW